MVEETGWYSKGLTRTLQGEIDTNCGFVVAGKHRMHITLDNACLAGSDIANN
jgi:hypothetical protein